MKTLRSEKGGYYHQTYVVVPKDVREGMRLAAGSVVFLSILSPRRVGILEQRKYVDDHG